MYCLVIGRYPLQLDRFIQCFPLNSTVWKRKSLWSEGLRKSCPKWNWWLGKDQLEEGQMGEQKLILPPCGAWAGALLASLSKESGRLKPQQYYWGQKEKGVTLRDLHSPLASSSLCKFSSSRSFIPGNPLLPLFPPLLSQSPNPCKSSCLISGGQALLGVEKTFPISMLLQKSQGERKRDKVA